MRLYMCLFVCVCVCVCVCVFAYMHLRSFVGEPFCVCVWLCVRGCVRTNKQMHVSICLVIFNCKNYYYFTKPIFYYRNNLLRQYFSNKLS